MAVSRRAYEQHVFINCPFDREYAPIFEAIVFAIVDCGFEPVCARQRINSAEFRLEKITEMIGSCRYSIHDLSRTEVDARYSLPRFNMPLELGITIRCAKFGAGRHRRKTALILDRRRYRYHKFISDISGQDISEHGNRPSRAVAAVRNWLRSVSGIVDMPGGEYVMTRYRRFRRDLPNAATRVRLNVRRLTYDDYCFAIALWLKENVR